MNLDTFDRPTREGTLMHHRWARRCYREMLRLGPPHLRRTHGAEMERFFAEILSGDVRKHGWWGYVSVWSWTLVDLVRGHFDSRRHRRARKPFWRGHLMKNFWQDLRYGVRLLIRNPGFTLTALITLALGIGANTAIFSVVNSVILRPLPFPEEDRLVVMWEAMPALGFEQVGFSPPDYKFLQEQQENFSHVGAVTFARYELSGRHGEPRRITASQVTSGFFRALGVTALHGRFLEPEEDQPGQAVAVLSHRLWRQHFASDASAVGQSIDLDRRPYTIVGVMPQGFQVKFPGVPLSDKSVDLWVPRAFTPVELQAFGMLYNHALVARLKEGVSLEAARAEGEVLATQIQEAYPARLQQFLKDASKDAQLQIKVAPLRENLMGPMRDPLLVLWAAVGLVLLIACVNVANLLLSRASARQKEIALRSALGASRAQLTAQMMGESLPLSLTGGLLGLALAALSLPVLLKVTPTDLLSEVPIGIDGWVLAFTLLLSLATSFIFSLAPSISAARQDPSASLQQGRGTWSGARRLHGVFVVAQTALALLLLIGAGLLLRSFANLMDVDPGFQPQRVLSLSVPLPHGAYSEAHKVRALYRDLLERVASLPGVSSVGASSDLPFHPTEVRAFQKEDDAASTESPPAVTHSWILGHYLQSLGVRLIRGRFFTPEDRADAPRVVLVSKTMAQDFWPDDDPIGKRVRWAAAPSWMTVVGIVDDVKDAGLHQEPRPHTYTPHLQEIDGLLVTPTWDGLRSLNIVARAVVDPKSLATSIREQLRELDPRLAVSEFRTMEEEIGAVTAPQRFNMTLLTVFAGLALFLSSVGLYGVVSYSVNRRTQEMGVRMALGAERGDMLGLILRQGLRLTLIGAAIGLAASLALSRVLAGLLFGVSAIDPLTFTVVPLVLLAVAALACLLPARRAARTDPIEALRYE